jgi:hypothetical protein
MKEKKFPVIVVAIVLVVGLSIIGAIGWHRYEQQQNVTHVQSTHSITYKGENGQTVLALLKKHAYRVTVKQTSYGPFVEAIDGVQGGNGGKYWLYYVNGKQAPVGAGVFKTKNGDTIIWKLQ